MLKFKKDFNAKIISIIVIITFTVTSIYGIELPKKSQLRVPLVCSKDGNGRARDIQEAMDTLSPNASLLPEQTTEKRQQGDAVKDLNQMGIVVDNIKLISEKKLRQLIELIKIIPNDHVKACNISFSLIRSSRYEDGHMYLRSFFDVVPQYVHELGHAVEDLLLKQENLEIINEFRNISWQRQNHSNLNRFIFFALKYIYFFLSLLGISYSTGVIFGIVPTITIDPIKINTLFIIFNILGIISFLFFNIATDLDERSEWNRRNMLHSGIISVVGFLDIYEDFATAYEEYVFNGDRFRRHAQKDTLIARKYTILKDKIFHGREYIKINGKIVLFYNQPTMKVGISDSL